MEEEQQGALEAEDSMVDPESSSFLGWGDKGEPFIYAQSNVPLGEEESEELEPDETLLDSDDGGATMTSFSSLGGRRGSRTRSSSFYEGDDDDVLRAINASAGAVSKDEEYLSPEGEGFADYEEEGAAEGEMRRNRNTHNQEGRRSRSGSTHSTGSGGGRRRCDSTHSNHEAAGHSPPDAGSQGERRRVDPMDDKSKGSKGMMRNHSDLNERHRRTLEQGIIEARASSNSAHRHKGSSDIEDSDSEAEEEDSEGEGEQGGYRSSGRGRGGGWGRRKEQEEEEDEEEEESEDEDDRRERTRRQLPGLHAFLQVSAPQKGGIGVGGGTQVGGTPLPSPKGGVHGGAFAATSVLSLPLHQHTQAPFPGAGGQLCGTPRHPQQGQHGQLVVQPGAGLQQPQKQPSATGLSENEESGGTAENSSANESMSDDLDDPSTSVPSSGLITPGSGSSVFLSGGSTVSSTTALEDHPDYDPWDSNSTGGGGAPAEGMAQVVSDLGQISTLEVVNNNFPSGGGGARGFDAMALSPKTEDPYSTHMMRGSPPQTVHKVKILMLGDTGVGKSSLMKRFVEGTFSPSLTGTVGVDFKTKNMNVFDEGVTVQVWDTAGQERFHKITHAYYRGCQGIVLVYDMSRPETLGNLEYWMKNIQANAYENVKTCLVGNKKDLRLKTDNQLVDTSEGTDVAARHGVQFYETSAKSGESVDEAFEAVVTECIAEMRRNNTKAAAVATTKTKKNRFGYKKKKHGDGSSSVTSNSSRGDKAQHRRKLSQSASWGGGSRFSSSQSGGSGQASVDVTVSTVTTSGFSSQEGLQEELSTPGLSDASRTSSLSSMAGEGMSPLGGGAGGFPVQPGGGAAVDYGSNSSSGGRGVSLLSNSAKGSSMTSSLGSTFGGKPSLKKKGHRKSVSHGAGGSGGSGGGGGSERGDCIVS